MGYRMSAIGYRLSVRTAGLALSRGNEIGPMTADRQALAASR